MEKIEMNPDLVQQALDFSLPSGSLVLEWIGF